MERSETSLFTLLSLKFYLINNNNIINNNNNDNNNINNKITITFYSAVILFHLGWIIWFLRYVLFRGNNVSDKNNLIHGTMVKVSRNFYIRSIRLQTRNSFDDQPSCPTDTPSKAKTHATAEVRRKTKVSMRRLTDTVHK